MEIAALVVSVFALLASTSSVWFSRKSANAATKSAAAAVNADKRGQADADAKRVVWEITGRANRPGLSNRGTHTAYLVEIEAGPDFHVNGEPTAKVPEWPPGKHVDFDVRPVARMLTVSWQIKPDDGTRLQEDIAVPRG